MPDLMMRHAQYGDKTVSNLKLAWLVPLFFLNCCSAFDSAESELTGQDSVDGVHRTYVRSDGVKGLIVDPISQYWALSPNFTGRIEDGEVIQRLPLIRRELDTGVTVDCTNENGTCLSLDDGIPLFVPKKVSADSLNWEIRDWRQAVVYFDASECSFVVRSESRIQEGRFYMYMFTQGRGITAITLGWDGAWTYTLSSGLGLFSDKLPCSN